MKNLFKRKKKALNTPIPRPLNEIQTEYTDVNSKLGQAQYQAFLYSKESERLSLILRNLNQEASARKDLDLQAAQKETQTVPVAEVKNG